MPIYFLVDDISGKQVVVDVGIASCSCSDFRENSSLFELGDPRRACKHLEEALAIEGLAASGHSEYPHGSRCM